jgi:hypothetical protein
LVADYRRAVKPEPDSELNEKGGKQKRKPTQRSNFKPQSHSFAFERWPFIRFYAWKTGVSTDEAAVFVGFISDFDRCSNCILLSAIG